MTHDDDRNVTINLNINIHGHADEFIRRALSTLLERSKTMPAELDALKTAVANNTSVIGSAITLLQGLKQKLDDAIASGDPAQLTALSTELGAQDQALSDAVAANTPAA